jgi:epoxyqueuosine reductase
MDPISSLPQLRERLDKEHLSMQIQDDLNHFIRADRRADYFGVANLSEAANFVRDQADGLLPDLPLALSIGIDLPDPIVDMLPKRAKRAVQVSYRTHAYDIVNRRLDLITSEISSILWSRGFKAFPIASSERVDDKRICAIFSHKLAANLSGLGWIGKSCLLITPKHGPRVRWASVLTDAPLQPTGKPLANQCGDCTECVDICPVKAFTCTIQGHG